MSLLNFDKLEGGVADLSVRFRSGGGLEYVVIDDACDEPLLSELEQHLPTPLDSAVKKSRDYIFAKNKFETQSFNVHPVLDQLRTELLSQRFRAFLCSLVGKDVFIDPHFHGGGIHQGGRGSFLDMHVDFNLHPRNNNWLRELNLLLYLNKGWRDSFGGQLKLLNLADEEGDLVQIEPLFNRLVIMRTNEFSLHGYDPIAFPQGAYRKSIAAYAYSLVDAGQSLEPRSTIWYSDSKLKRWVGQRLSKLIVLKTKFFGSGTGR